jgi:hypothetical protein
MRYALALFFSLMMSTTVAQEYTVKMVVPQQEALSERWCFVIDGSDSIKTVLPKAIVGFRRVTNISAERLNFTAVLFSGELPTPYYKDEKRFFSPGDIGHKWDWFEASPNTFKELEKWIQANIGVTSFSHMSLKSALTIRKRNLTLVLITDGGFTEACGEFPIEILKDGSKRDTRFDETEKLINKWQKWRKKNGFNYAIIASIGIRNSHYSDICMACRQQLLNEKVTARHNYKVPDNWENNIGDKPSDEKCQDYLMHLGSKWHGGYYIVEKK